MTTIIDRMENVKRVGKSHRGRCPACAQNGGDQRGEHLMVFEDGRYGCAAHPNDHEHRSEIWKCMGLPRPEGAIRVPIVPFPKIRPRTARTVKTESLRINLNTNPKNIPRSGNHPSVPSVNADIPGLDSLAPYAEASKPPFDPVESWGHANAWDAYTVESNPYGPGMLHQNPDKAGRWLKGWLEADAEIKRFEAEETSTDSDWRTRS